MQHPISSAHLLTLCGSAFPQRYWLFIAGILLTSSHHNHYFFISHMLRKYSWKHLRFSICSEVLFQPSLSALRRPTRSISEERSAVSCWARKSAGRKIRYQPCLAVGSNYYCQCIYISRHKAERHCTNCQRYKDLLEHKGLAHAAWGFVTTVTFGAHPRLLSSLQGQIAA